MFAALKLTVAMFEKIMRELWVSGLIGGVLGGLVVVVALVLAGVLRLSPAAASPPPDPPESSRDRRPRSRTPVRKRRD